MRVAMQASCWGMMWTWARDDVLTAWIESFVLDEMYMTNSNDLRSAKTKIYWLDTNLASSSKHAHGSGSSNKYPPTHQDLFGIGESYVSWTLRETPSPVHFGLGQSDLSNLCLISGSSCGIGRTLLMNVTGAYVKRNLYSSDAKNELSCTKVHCPSGKL